VVVDPTCRATARADRTRAGTEANEARSDPCLSFFPQAPRSNMGTIFTAETQALGAATGPVVAYRMFLRKVAPVSFPAVL